MGCFLIYNKQSKAQISWFMQDLLHYGYAV